MPITSKEKKGLAKNKIYTIYKNQYTNEIEIRSIDKRRIVRVIRIIALSLYFNISFTYVSI